MLTTLTIIAWSILGIQIICLVSLLIAFSGKREQPIANEEVPVSVIVCAHDEEENLRALIPLLLNQQYGSFEVIIVEDRCNDGTFDYLLEATRLDPRLKMVRVRYLPEHVSGKKYALTLGIKAASYEWILLTDADCRPASDKWIQSMTSHFQAEKEIVIGYSPYIKFPTYLNSFIRFESLVTGIQFIGAALSGRPYMGVGRNLAYRKNLFFDNKGFNKHLHVTGGDDDLFINMVATKNNTAIVTDKEAHTLSEPKKTWNEWQQQKFRHYTTSKYYKGKHKFLLGLYSFTQILVYPLCIAAILFYNWWLALAVLGLRMAIQGFIWYKSMKKLNEADLWPYFIFLDIWMFFYYLLFAPALFKKPARSWN